MKFPNGDFFVISKYFNESLDKGIFPNCLKLANITPASINNCSPFSILPVLPELFKGRF